MKLPNIGEKVKVDLNGDTIELIVKETVPAESGAHWVWLHAPSDTFKKGDACHWKVENNTIRTTVYEVAEVGLIRLKCLPGS
jgi:hypothetical protein